MDIPTEIPRISDQAKESEAGPSIIKLDVKDGFDQQSINKNNQVDARVDLDPKERVWRFVRAIRKGDGRRMPEGPEEVETTDDADAGEEKPAAREKEEGDLSEGFEKQPKHPPSFVTTGFMDKVMNNLLRQVKNTQKETLTAVQSLVSTIPRAQDPVEEEFPPAASRPTLPVLRPIISLGDHCRSW